MVLWSSFWLKNKKTANIEWRTHKYEAENSHRLKTKWRFDQNTRRPVGGKDGQSFIGLFELFGQFISI